MQFLHKVIAKSNRKNNFSNFFCLANRINGAVITVIMMINFKTYYFCEPYLTGTGERILETNETDLHSI